MEEDLTELAEEAKEDDENDDREDEKKGWLSYQDSVQNFGVQFYKLILSKKCIRVTKAAQK